MSTKTIMKLPTIATLKDLRDDIKEAAKVYRRTNPAPNQDLVVDAGDTTHKRETLAAYLDAYEEVLAAMHVPLMKSFTGFELSTSSSDPSIGFVISRAEDGLTLTVKVCGEDFVVTSSQRPHTRVLLNPGPENVTKNRLLSLVYRTLSDLC